MDTRTRRAIDAAASTIERQTGSGSRQPRFERKGTAFGQVLHFLKLTEIEQPPYASNSMARDSWLRTVWKLEPRLAGVLNTVLLVDSNRGWTLTGGRNQVRRFTAVLHRADGNFGWRGFMRRASLSYWATDMGSVTELGREGEHGPLRDLYHVDSARCHLTGNPERPLRYYPAAGMGQEWAPGDFIRCASMPSDDEAFNRLGFCAVSRCIELLRLMYAVMVHDQEQVAARAPKGLLLLQGISEQQWEDSLAARKAENDGLERAYYGGVQVLANTGVDQLDAKLVALSTLPANFDAKMFMDLSMYSYALGFGYDPREFWPVSGGQLGTSLETEAQSRKATGKGGSEFPLSFQERLQDELPPTLAFEFEQRDDEGELQSSAVQAAKVGVISQAYNTGLMQGAPLISRDEARVLLAEQGIIPPEWTAADEEVTATDTEEVDTAAEEDQQPQSPDEESEEAPLAAPPPSEADRHLQRPEVRYAMRTFKHEPIVQRHWPTNRETVLWDPGVRRFWPVGRRAERASLFSKGGVVITEEDVKKAIKHWNRVNPELAGLLDAEVVDTP